MEENVEAHEDLPEGGELNSGWTNPFTVLFGTVASGECEEHLVLLISCSCSFIRLTASANDIQDVLSVLKKLQSWNDDRLPTDMFPV
jgi:hypothetical protein